MRPRDDPARCNILPTGNGGQRARRKVERVRITRAIPWKAALGNWVINWGIDMHPRVARAPRRVAVVNEPDYTIALDY